MVSAPLLLRALSSCGPRPGMNCAQACISIAIAIALHCIALHCIALHCTALHCTALHCIALHCIACNDLQYFGFRVQCFAICYDPADVLCMQAVKPDLSNFDGTTSAWPLLIDEFVDHIRERGPKQIDVSED